MRLRENIEKIEDTCKMLQCKLHESEIKYGELISELTNKHNRSLNTLVSPKGYKKIRFSHQGQKGSIEFQRLINTNLEKENKEMREEIEYLRIRVSEMDNKKVRDNAGNNLTKDLINQLSLGSEKELYKRVLYLREFYNQSKDQRKFIQKLTGFVAQKTNKKTVSLKDVWNFLDSNYS